MHFHTMCCSKWDFLLNTSWIVIKPTQLSVNELDNAPPLAVDYQKRWQHWAGREKEFYCEAFKLVDNLNRKAFNHIGGIWQEILLKDLEDKYQVLTDSHLPDVLICIPRLTVKRVAEDCFV